LKTRVLDLFRTSLNPLSLPSNNTLVPTVGVSRRFARTARRTQVSPFSAGGLSLPGCRRGRNAAPESFGVQAHFFTPIFVLISSMKLVTSTICSRFASPLALATEADHDCGESF
jgi:hypothetical protein